MGSKFVPDEFRPHSGYMSFYNHITTVFLTRRGGKSDNTLGYIGRNAGCVHATTMALSRLTNPNVVTRSLGDILSNLQRVSL